MGRFLISVFIAVIVMFPSTSAAGELIHYFTDSNFIYYGWNPPRALDMGDWIRVELVTEPVSNEMIQAFRQATGGLEPGHTITTFGFDKNSPRIQVTKVVWIADNGASSTRNWPFSPSQWEPIQPQAPQYLLWEILTGRR